MKLTRVLTVAAATLALVFVMSCGSDGGDGGGTCDPTCDANACLTCTDGACVTKCATGETCDGAGTCAAATPCDPACVAPQTCVNGACMDPATPCDPACVAPQTCENGTCVDPATPCDPACVAPQTCENGTCVDPATPCDPACVADDCMTCNAGTCESMCDANETCDGAGTCEANMMPCDPECVADDCMTCNDGTCESTCTADQTCDGAGTCEDDVVCDPACDAATQECVNGVCEDIVVGGACENADDLAILDDENVDPNGTAKECLLGPCGTTGGAECFAECISEGNTDMGIVGIGLSGDCAVCYGETTVCAAINCLAVCLADPNGDPCIQCLGENCIADFCACAGAQASTNCQM